MEKSGRWLFCRECEAAGVGGDRKGIEGSVRFLTGRGLAAEPRQASATFAATTAQRG